MNSTPQKGKPTGAGTTAGSKTKHTHAPIVARVADELALTTTATEARIDSRLLAKQLGNKHKNTMELAMKNLAALEAFGKVAFKTEPLPDGFERAKASLLALSACTMLAAQPTQKVEA